MSPSDLGEITYNFILYVKIYTYKATFFCDMLTFLFKVIFFFGKFSVSEKCKCFFKTKNS